MLKSKSYSVTLGYEEVYAVEKYQEEHCDKNFCSLASHAAFTADYNGITVHCVSNKQADELWNAVLTATDHMCEEGLG